MRSHAVVTAMLLVGLCAGQVTAQTEMPDPPTEDASGVSQRTPREVVSINDGWRFTKGDPSGATERLRYDVRPEVTEARDDRPADARPTEAVDVAASLEVLKPWILPSGNAFIADPDERHVRPEGHPGSDVAYVQQDFDDGSWERVDLPHDWAIEGPWLEEGLYGGMGRLPSWGVGWYRKELDISASDADKRIFLDIDGAMSYATVWLNGQLVGGWPFGYASWRLELTPYVVPGGENQLAIRLDNPPSSSRWYPGAGLYRNVWLIKTAPVHVGHWGTYVTTPEVSAGAATVELAVTVDNGGSGDASVRALTHVFVLDADGRWSGEPVARFEPVEVAVAAGESATIESVVTIQNARLWGPPPTQTPHRYVAVTELQQDGETVDRYETPFGIRRLRFDADRGFFVNGEHVYIKGVNLHHDLGALGAAFNTRAAERQLELLHDMGANAIRTAHNPPAPELLELADRMGFLVVDESFDVWARKKTPLDFHLIFADWHEQDLRALVRRDRNHPSVIMWSTGNEVGEQYTEEEGAAMAWRLHEIVREEDPTRPTTASMNFAKPDMPFPRAMDVISLNYQGEGIRDAPAYAHLQGITTPPLYPAFHAALPEKVILSSENAAALSSRGEYVFPVFDGISAPVSDSTGGNPETQQVSGYELYTAPFGSSADKVFRSLDQHPYVAGGFVWSGWDYLGEPTPYYDARSSYYGIIDLAGFPKDRFYLYQSRWRPDLPMAHILPHWNWPEREGEATPVHVFTSGDEAELFLNGVSLGRKTKGAHEYRLRWDGVVYEPGTLDVVAYRDGKEWARDTMATAGAPVRLEAEADRTTVNADGDDLSFVTVRVVDAEGRMVPRAANTVRFAVEGPGEIVATSNGDPTSFEPFQAHERRAFNGLVLAIVRGVDGEAGEVVVTAESDGLQATTVVIQTLPGNQTSSDP